ncbi:IS5 family transposase [Desulfovibrio sp. 6_1_46AFAA]|uniref:IS5 family transposase n=1 Tax=Desulfovibrio sp. 6_1_46AFAA TaxID=665942 RepID=UPI0012EAE6FB|nr:IS5 family transposase [Desulfovibrio sp. 6_1_46AFAA]
MQKRHALRDDQWERICEALPGKDTDPGRTSKDNRLFIEAVMWIAKTGAPWRDLPPEYGKWSNVHKRFMRWAKNGVWQMIFNTLAVDADTEWLMIDSTIVRAHQHAAGAKGGQQCQALGRSRGGFGTKIHALSDALGNPMRFILTGGEKSDFLQACPLLEEQRAEAVLADKGYDAGYIVDAIQAMGAEAVIPPKLNRNTPRNYDVFLYKERNVIERMFGKMKHFRGIATRYSKTAVSFLAFVQLAAISLWLK